MPQVVHPWSEISALTPPTNPTTFTPLPADASVASVANALFRAGFVAAAIETAKLSADPVLQDQAATWRDTQAADVHLATTIAEAGAAVIPSASLRDDGAPRFMLVVPDRADAGSIVAEEHGAFGVDVELRLFLDEAMRPGDVYIDAAPGVGFAALSAASGTAGSSVVVLCETEALRTALHQSAALSNVSEQLSTRLHSGLGELPTTPAANGSATFLHAGSADAVAPLLSASLAALERQEISAVAWRCQSADGAERAGESVQVAAAVLGVFGFQHFALTRGAADHELVPASAVSDNTMIFSLHPSLLERFS